jgi:hypothetical protein
MTWWVFGLVCVSLRGIYLLSGSNGRCVRRRGSDVRTTPWFAVLWRIYPQGVNAKHRGHGQGIVSLGFDWPAVSEPAPDAGAQR